MKLARKTILEGYGTDLAYTIGRNSVTPPLHGSGSKVNEKGIRSYPIRSKAFLRSSTGVLSYRIVVCVLLCRN